MPEQRLVHADRADIKMPRLRMQWVSKVKGVRRRRKRKRIDV